MTDTFFPIYGMTPGRFAGGPFRRFAVAFGVFDGVHPGHRKVIGALRNMAQKHHAAALAVTFDPHPRAVLAPQDPPKLILTLPDRIRRLRQAGADEVLVIPFSAEIARLEPVEFLDKFFFCPGMEIVGIAVGENFRFGNKGAGNAETLRQFAAAHKMDFAAVPIEQYGQEVVSSSAIRRLIASGRLDEASRFLQERYVITGTVTQGVHYASTALETPTANLDPGNLVLPPDGVYAAVAELESEQRYPAVVNIGLSPSFAWGGRRRVEAHLLHFHGTLYGKKLSLELRKFLRSERIFPDGEALKKQIALDIDAVSAAVAQ
ncbi:MAG: riboflavin biosynthesis protein RibF [Victivallaceae bacterium]|nr:riboflavin biosynthesis protein RibF [Victivallaceae bacterium]